MLLCIDIGNTNVTIGLYEKEKLSQHWRLSTDPKRTSDEYALDLTGLLSQRKVKSPSVTDAVLISVVPPLTAAWVDACQSLLGFKPLVVDAGVKTGVRVLCDDPRSVGADRIVNAAAAYRLYGGPACVVDFGTATTFDAVSEKGDYLGGAIAPGIGIASEALFIRTAKLPKVEISRPPQVIGKNTVHSMQSGILYGYVGLVEGLVARFRSVLGPQMKVVGTGGLLDAIAAETNVFDHKAPWLTLEGLRMIYETNKNAPAKGNGEKLAAQRKG